MPSSRNGPGKEVKPRTLANRYKVERKLGSGSFGTVHVVEDLKSQDKWKVLKEIPVGDLQPDETVSAVREARLLSKLDHPGIVKFHDSFIDGEHFCIVTEFCEDGDLDDKICERRKSGKLFDESRILTWLMQLLLAVQYMHERRILHRDLKTRNIFLKNNMIKVGDFGISRILMGTTDIATTFTGTPYYMSPEVLKHEGYNAKSDVWSLGVILYELCSLKRAFQGQNLMGVMFKIVQNDPPVFPKNYSEELSGIYLSILNKDPQRRPSASDLLKHPFIVKHIGVLKTKMNGKTHPGKKVEEDSKAIAKFLSASAKKGDISAARDQKPRKEAKEQLRPMTPGERLKRRKQEKADEEARKLSQITAQSYRESRQKYSETKSKQSHVSTSLPWATENNHNNHADEEDESLSTSDYHSVYSPTYSNEDEDEGTKIADVDKRTEVADVDEDTQIVESDALDLTNVSDIPEEEELANTYYSQADEFEDEFEEEDEDEYDDETCSSSGSESEDEYGALMQCMGDALDLQDTCTEHSDSFDNSTGESLSTTSARMTKIESLRSECRRLLGAEEFHKAYDYLKRIRFGDEESILSEASIMDGLRGLVTKPRDCFLVDQLLFLEKQEEIRNQSR